MSNSHPQTIVILLAGGKSSRAEKIKGLRRVNNNYWIDIVLQHYQNMNLSGIFVGLGYHHDHYQNKSVLLNNSSSQVNYTINKNPVNGSFSTLQTSLKEALNHHWEFALVLPIDCALASESLIMSLLMETQYKVVKPTFNNQSGHPIKLSRNFCKKLMEKPKKTQLDNEIRKIKKTHIYWQKVEDDSIHYNLNTQESWEDYIKKIEFNPPTKF